MLAEDLLLCLTDDDTGRLVVPARAADLGLGGAMMVELSLRERIALAGGRDEGSEDRLVVRDSSPTGDPLLDAALATVGQRRSLRPRSAVGLLGRHLRMPLYERLAGAGIVRLEHGRVLGIVPTDRWPTQDTRHESGIRADITTALRAGSTEDPHVAALISLLLALDVVHHVVDLDDLGLTRRQARAIAKTIAEGDWAGQALRQAIDRVNAAIIAATSSAVAMGGGA